MNDLRIFINYFKQNDQYQSKMLPQIKKVIGHSKNLNYMFCQHSSMLKN